jgi:hypothetical protein
MTVVGFNFNKINVERLGPRKGKINIATKSSTTGITEAKVPFNNEKTKCLKISFTFESTYEPSVASIKFEGELLFLFPIEKADEVLAKWDESKGLLKDVTPAVMNPILDKCSIQALILSKELNLPSPIQLPKIKAN